MLPTVGYWDTGEFQTIPYTFDIAHPTGYPTYILLGKIFTLIIPFGSIAWRLNLFSVTLSILTLLFFYLTIRIITNNKIIGLISLPILGSVPIYWGLSLQAEVHIMHIFFTSIQIYLMSLIIQKKSVSYLYLLILISAISLGNHLLTIFSLPSVFLSFLYLLIRNRKKLRVLNTIVVSFCLFFIGISIYLILPIIAYRKPSLTFNYQLVTFSDFRNHVLGNNFQGHMNHWTKGNFDKTIVYFYDFLTENLSFFIIALGYIGTILGLIKKKLISILIILLTLLSLYFSLRYQNGFLERYFLTTIYSILLFFSIFIDFVNKIISNLLSKLKINIKNYFLLIILLVNNILTLDLIIANYNKNDKSQDYSAYKYAEEKLSYLPPNSTLVSWWSYSTPMWYLQKVEKKYNNINIFTSGHQDWENYILDHNTEKIYLIEKINLNSPKLQLIESGPVYKVVRVTSP